MSRAWIVSNKNKTIEIKNELHHKEWCDNASGIAEVIVLLQLVMVIEQRGRCIQYGKIEISFNNKRNYRKIVEDLQKK